MKLARILFAAAAFAFASLANAAATIHIPDAVLSTAMNGGINFGTDSIKCALIDITSYAQATDATFADVTEVTGTGYTAGGNASTATVALDTTNHWVTITLAIPSWTSSTISATGAACYDVTASNKLVAIDDFGGTVASSSGTYSVGNIVLKFTGF